MSIGAKDSWIQVQLTEGEEDIVSDREFFPADPGCLDDCTDACGSGCQSKYFVIDCIQPGTVR